jgi:hypothetical protein
MPRTDPCPHGRRFRGGAPTRTAAISVDTHDQRVIIGAITRASVDGGSDAIGRYRFGLAQALIALPAVMGELGHLLSIP